MQHKCWRRLKMPRSLKVSKKEKEVNGKNKEESVTDMLHTAGIVVYALENRLLVLS